MNYSENIIKRFGGKKLLGLFLFLCAIVFFVYGCDVQTIPAKDAQIKAAQCYAQNKKPWYTFKKQGDKKSGILSIECVHKDYPNAPTEESSVRKDDDTVVTAGGMPSLSGLPGGPF